MNVRLRGFLSFAGFAAVFAIVVFWFANPELYPFDYQPRGPLGAIAIGTPGALALVGLVELASGRPFHQLEEAWASLAWWQRGIWGTIIVLLGGAVAFTVVLLALL